MKIVNTSFVFNDSRIQEIKTGRGFSLSPVFIWQKWWLLIRGDKRRSQDLPRASCGTVVLIMHSSFHGAFEANNQGTDHGSQFCEAALQSFAGRREVAAVPIAVATRLYPRAT